MKTIAVPEITMQKNSLHKMQAIFYQAVQAAVATLNLKL